MVTEDEGQRERHHEREVCVGQENTEKETKSDMERKERREKVCLYERQR